MENKNKYIFRIYEISFSLLAVISLVIAIINMQNEYIFSSSVDSEIEIFINILFILDYVIRLLTSEDKVEFFKSNKLDLIAIIPFNSIFKAFRVFKLLRLLRFFKFIRVLAYLARLGKRTCGILKQNGTIYLITFTVFIMFFSSVIISYTENMSLGNSLWWSFVTTTTVGYGDISPKTTVGRITAIILMLLGIGSIGMITGSISTFFIKKDNDIDVQDSSSDADEIKKYFELYKQGALSENEYIEIKNSILNRIKNK